MTELEKGQRHVGLGVLAKVASRHSVQIWVHFVLLWAQYRSVASPFSPEQTHKE